MHKTKPTLLILAGLLPFTGHASVGCPSPEMPVATFYAAAQAALCRAPEVQRAHATAQGREASAALQDANGRPSLGLSGGAQSRSVGGVGETTQNDAALQLDWVAWDGGRRAADSAAAHALSRAAQSDLAQTKLDVLYEAATAWLTLSQASERIAALTASETLAKELADMARARLSAGLVTRADLLQAEADWLTAKHAVVSARLLAETASAEYQRITGQSGVALASLDSALEALAPTAVLLEEQTDSHIAELALARPLVAAQGLRVQSADQSVQAARKAYSPTVTLSARLGASGERDALEDSRSVAAVLNVPLYTGGARDARTRLALAEREAHVASQEELRRKTRSQAQTAQGRLAQTRLAIDSAQAGLDAAASALAAARGRYEAGVGTLADLLRAQSTLAHARVALTEAKAARASAVIELSYLTGQLTTLIETPAHAH